MTTTETATSTLEPVQLGGKRPGFWNVPNSISMARLVLALLVFVLVAYHAYAAALVVFAIAAGSDALDGYLARKLGQESAVGRQLDPLVDKVLVAGTLIYLLPVDQQFVPAWLVTTVVVRELIVQAIRSLVEGRGIAFGAKMAGKLKTAVQCVAICLVLGCLAWPALSGFRLLAIGLMWTAAALTVYSGWVYVAAAWPLLTAGSARDR